MFQFWGDKISMVHISQDCCKGHRGGSENLSPHIPRYLMCSYHIPHIILSALSELSCNLHNNIVKNVLFLFY